MITHSQGQLRMTGQLGGLDLDDDSQPRPVKNQLRLVDWCRQNGVVIHVVPTIP